MFLFFSNSALWRSSPHSFALLSAHKITIDRGRIPIKYAIYKRSRLLFGTAEKKSFDFQSCVCVRARCLFCMVLFSNKRKKRENQNTDITKRTLEFEKGEQDKRRNRIIIIIIASMHLNIRCCFISQSVWCVYICSVVLFVHTMSDRIHPS